MIRLLSILLILTSSFSFAMADESIDELMTRLSAEFATIQTVQTRFVETKQIRILEQNMELTGRLAIEKPERLAWRVEKPLACTLIIADGKVKQWDEDSQSVQSFSSRSNPVFAMVLDQMQNWFSGNFVTLQADYDVTVEQDAPLILLFKPHADSPNAQAIKNVRVTIREDLRYVQSIRIADSSGDITDMTFVDTVLNEAVPPETWKVQTHGR
jgi:outer membrane lipoprotein-sorting protein